MERGLSGGFSENPQQTVEINGLAKVWHARARRRPHALALDGGEQNRPGLRIEFAYVAQQFHPVLSREVHVHEHDVKLMSVGCEHFDRLLCAAGNVCVIAVHLKQETQRPLGNWFVFDD
jgi:hypothetical protein